ncbi:cytochrome c oxidase assembly protein [Mycolicibacterium neoaurum]|uniref:cytochrome c oxidase assembly protein n=1 Tax=Mycolicibacterium neoaurum TaxID=1795 RepID=UPI00248C2E13|nr:cytochrome c oxidase assembly protein [Mycolicibacterium neoaurum]WBP92732.1 cytochrome c oxidase assembly protein [Mycolicibacterium neoaurum]WBS06294.1 cytochrome c oxidase assembly protein [Mycolicibacterium neoaurum]
MSITASSPGPRSRWFAPAFGFVVVTVGALITGYSLVTARARFDAAGLPFPGTATSTAEFIGYFAATLAGALTAGSLVYIVTTAVPDANGRIDASAYRMHLWLERSAIIWFCLSACMIVVDAANAAGVAVSELIVKGGIGDALGASESGRGWCAVALAALVVTVGSRFTVRWMGHVLLLIPALIGLIGAPVTGNSGEGPDHDFATSAVVVFAVAIAIMFGIKIAAAVNATLPEAIRRRVQLLSVAAGVAAVVYGLGLTTMMTAGTSVLATGYGRIALIVMAVLAAIVLSDTFLMVTDKAAPPFLATAGAFALVGVIGGLSAMAVQPAPRFLVETFTSWDVFLGYELPGPPSPVNLLTFWRFDPLFGVAALIMLVAYLIGVIRLRRRGDSWPRGRTVAWVIGSLTLLLATSSGLRAYGSAMFSVHMAEHMILNMFIPVLLVLGAPVTLALRVLPAATGDQAPGPREWIQWFVHSPVTKFLSHPIVAFMLFVGSLYLVYFTPLFDTLVRYHWGHELMTLHFLLVGYLYYWGIIGIDPGPKRLPFLGRLGLLFAVMPFHAFFGIAAMTMTGVMGGTFYGHVALPWLAGLNDDQHLGGAIAWGASEVPVVIVVIALVAQWARQDRRAGARQDRHADTGYDDDLDAYNAMLAELARTRK